MSSSAAPTETRKQQDSADMSTAAAAFARKAALRGSMLKTLRGMSDAELEKQSRAVFDILVHQSFFTQAKSVGCYLSMARGELQTTGIVSDILQRGTPLFTPFIPQFPPTSLSTTPLSTREDDRSDMKMLRLYSPDDLRQCPLDKWGILDPGESRRDRAGVGREDAMDFAAPPLDLILIPGVAFDAECNRLGRGKAYYDRFLLSYTSTRRRPLLVALALEPQILPPGETVPTTELDFQLDAVVSPRGILWRGEKRGGSNGKPDQAV